MSRYFRFKVQLQRIRPPAWRRFLLPAASSFADLHEAIQESCGWQDCHKYTFLEAGARRVEIPADAMDSGEPSWSSTPLASWFSRRDRARRKCVYWYDFGDDWLHEVELEGLEDHPDDQGRRLLAGARSFPPEDSGGIPGYARCLRVRKRHRSPVAGIGELDEEDAELLDWLGDWEPERFDLDEERRHFERRSSSQPTFRGKATTRWLSANAQDFVDELGLPRADSGPAGKLARHLCRIVMAASLHAPGEHVTTGLPCPRRPDRRRCRGYITVTRQGERGHVEWCCSVCSDGGVVAGWCGGRYDLRSSAPDAFEPLEKDLQARIPADVYGALLDERTLAIASGRLLYSAQASAGQVVLRGSIDAFEDLYEESCADASHAPRGVFQKRLETACEILRAAIEPQTERENAEDEWAVVAQATHGLALASEELEGLRILARETKRIFSGVDLDLGDTIVRTLRDTGETLILEREIRAVLSVRSVDYRHFPIFLRTLEATSERLEAFAGSSPTSCLELYRRFLSGIGEIAGRIHVDENDLADFVEQVARAALDLARKDRRPTSGLRPLLADLVNLWSADDCCAFYFVPDLIVGLGLGKRDRGWLRKEIEMKIGDLSEVRVAELREFANRLS